MKDVIYDTSHITTAATTTPDNNLTDRNTFSSLKNSFHYMKKLFELDEDHQLIDLDLYDIEPVMDSSHRPSYSMQRSATNDIMGKSSSPETESDGDMREKQSVSLRFDQSIFASTEDRAKLQTWVLSSVPVTYQQSLKATSLHHNVTKNNASLEGNKQDRGLFIK